MLTSAELDDLVDTLRGGGYATVPSARAELVRLLSHHAHGFAAPDRIDRAGRLIGPVVCRTAEEQHRFAALYAAWSERWRAPAPASPVAGWDSESPAPAAAPAALPSRWPSVLACAALLATLLALSFSTERLRLPARDGVDWTVPDDLSAARGASALGASARSNDATGVLRLVGLLAPVLVLAFWLHWRFASRRAVRARFPPGHDPAAHRFVAAGDPLAVLFPPARRTALVDYRRWRPRREARVDAGLDVARSIEATASAAGRVVLVPAAVAEVQTYVALIETRSADDHAARLSRLLVQLLRDQEIEVEVLEVRCRPEASTGEGGDPAPVSLEAVRRRHPRACFLLFLDPVQCCAGDGGLQRWLVDLIDTHACALLALTTADEARLAPAADAGAAVVARTLLGLGEIPVRLARAPRGAGPPVGRATAARDGGADRREASTDAPADPCVDPGFPVLDPRWRGEAQALVRTLSERFDPDTVRWLAALAGYPRLSFDLTAYLGASLHDDCGRRLLTEDRLRGIAGIDWLRDGAIPPHHRACLLGTLGRREAKEIRTLLYAVIGGALLEPGPAPSSPSPVTGARRAAVRAFLRTRADGDPLVDRVLTRFLLHPRLAVRSLALPEPLARLLGFRVDAVPLAAVLLALGAVALSGGLVDAVARHLPEIDAWVASHRMWVGLGLYLLAIATWSGFWTAVMLSPRYETLVSELWRPRVRPADALPPDEYTTAASPFSRPP